MGALGFFSPATGECCGGVGVSSSIGSASAPTFSAGCGGVGFRGFVGVCTTKRRGTTSRRCRILCKITARAWHSEDHVLWTPLHTAHFCLCCALQALVL